MKRSEQALLGATVVILAVFIVARMGLVDVTGLDWRALMGPAAQLEQARAESKRTLEYLSRLRETQRRYHQVVSERVPEEASGRDPRAKLTEDVVDLCRKLKIEQPALQPAEIEPFPDEDVEDYEFVTVSARYNKDWDSVVQLLKHFNDNYFLIKELKIVSPIDRDQLNVDIRLARVVRISEEEKARRAREEREARRSGVTRRTAGQTRRSSGRTGR